MIQGTVIKNYGKFYTVKYNDSVIDCVLRGKIRKDKRLKKFSDPVAVGDIVDFEISDETGVIDSIHERKNAFTRKDRYSNKEDLIAANCDLIAVVQSFKTPPFNLRFVDRLLVSGNKEEIPVMLIVNKSDLADDSQHQYINDYYRGVDIIFKAVSALENTGIEDLRKELEEKQTIFVGSSGVGKTSILNTLFPQLDLRISHVSESSGKGRHTTTNVEMVELDSGVKIIDTPGLREFGLVDIDPDELGEFFCEFASIEGCNFRPCSHDHEPKCGVKDLLAEGIIHPDRYQSYLNILKTLRDHYDNMY
jgi:ribosome biogenesis GTPase